jgi:two-component system, probable response regulator PhcQ
MLKVKKLLYVDDEALALKYFERLVGGIVPVLTADSVAAGIKMLEEHGDDIAILVTDQRMPGAYGNELLRYAREHHPKVVRMLTTAYSEIDDAISAINSGEIYRYLTKPWNVDALRADLKNALELADLKAERDSLLQAKLSVRRGQWLATRIGMLSAVLVSVLPSKTARQGFHYYLGCVAANGGVRLDIPWAQTDLADWVQAEAQRHGAIAMHVQTWCTQWSVVAPTPNEAQAQQVLSTPVVQQSFKHIGQLLEESATVQPALDSCASLAWCIWTGRSVSPHNQGFALDAASTLNLNLSSDWLAGDIETLIQSEPS